MREYIDSLEASGEKMTAEAWKEWINKEIEDLKNQGSDNTDIDIDEVIEQLDADGYVVEEKKRYSVFYAGGEKDGQIIITTDKLSEAVNAASEAEKEETGDNGVVVYDEQEDVYIEY